METKATPRLRLIALLTLALFVAVESAFHVWRHTPVNQSSILAGLCLLFTATVIFVRTKGKPS